jgi:hypothetical protein
MIERILSVLFPPRLPGRIDREVQVEYEFQEQGSAGPVKRKLYRNGIERFYAENGVHIKKELTAR